MVFYGFNSGSKASIIGSDVILEQGTSGTSVVYTNATSAFSQMDSHSTTFYPNDYNVTHGSYVSGSTPNSVDIVDADYFMVNSSGSGTSDLSYNPTLYTLLGGTSLVSGSLENLTSNDGVDMVFQSYYYLNNTLDYVDSNLSDVDSVPNVGSFSNFTAEKTGPDGIYDVLTEEKLTDYVDSNSSDVDSSAGIGSHSNFTAQQSGPDGVYDTLTEVNVAPTVSDPVTIWDGILKSATKDETTRKVFRNPRGLKYYYTFFLQDVSSIQWLYYSTSQYGSSWSTPVAIQSTDGLSIDSFGVTIKEDAANSRLVVYIALTEANKNTNLGTLTFKNTYIDDAGSLLNTQSTQTLDTGTNKITCSRSAITIAQNGYIWIAYEKSLDAPKKDYDVMAIVSSFTAPTLGSTWQTTAIVDSSSTYPERQYITVVPLTAGGDCGIVWNYENLYLRAKSGSSSGGAPTFGTLRSLSARLEEYLVSAVADEDTGDVHILYKDDYYLKHVNWTIGTGFGTPDTVTASRVDSLSLSKDATSSPDILYAFYIDTEELVVENFEGTFPPTGWSATGEWMRDSVVVYDGTYSAKYQSTGTSGNLDTPAMNTSGESCIVLDFYWRINNMVPNRYRLYAYDGSSWDLIHDLGNTAIYPVNVWLHSTDYSFSHLTDAQYMHSNFIVRFAAESFDAGRTAWIDFTNICSLPHKISYKNTTSTQINWGTEQTIQENAGVDYLSSSIKDHNGDSLIQIVYTTVTNDLVRFVERPYKYQLDLEVQFTSVNTNFDVTRLAIKIGATDPEQLGVNIWNTTSGAWDALVPDVTANGWTNVTITSYVSSTITLQFKDGKTPLDNRQDSWQIDSVRLNQHNNTYNLNLEAQWTDVIHNRVNEYLCIYGGVMGPESLMVDIWYNSTWNNVLSGVSTGWNNVSVSSYLDSPTFTIRFRGGDEFNEDTQDSWQIDASLLHLWSDEYVCEVELEGSSNLYGWDQIMWLTDSSWTADSVKVTTQLYNYTSASYPESGDGFTRYTSGSAGVDASYNQTIASSPENFRNGTGWWRLKIQGVKVTDTPYNLELDQMYLQTTYYDEYTAQTEFIFTDVTPNNSPSLNFTVVTHNSVDGATVTIQVWNYTSSSFPTSGQGYLSFNSTGANNTRWVNVTKNAQSCLSGSYARIRVTSVYPTTDIYQQLTNFVRLLQEESQRLHDYALRITNTGADPYTVRLNHLGNAGIDRLINCTIYLSSGGTQIQVLDGAVTQTQGGWVSLGGFSSLDILISASSIARDKDSVITAEVEALKSGTSTYAKLPVQFVVY